MITREHLREWRSDIWAPIVAAITAAAFMGNLDDIIRLLMGLGEVLRDVAGWLS